MNTPIIKLIRILTLLYCVFSFLGIVIHVLVGFFNVQDFALCCHEGKCNYLTMVGVDMSENENFLKIESEPRVGNITYVAPLPLNIAIFISWILHFLFSAFLYTVILKVRDEGIFFVEIRNTFTKVCLGLVALFLWDGGLSIAIDAITKTSSSLAISSESVIWIIIAFFMADMIREGARLREEAELTI